MMEFVSWDDDIPNIRKVIKDVPNHQPGGIKAERTFGSWDKLAVMETGL